MKFKIQFIIEATDHHELLDIILKGFGEKYYIEPIIGESDLYILQNKS